MKRLLILAITLLAYALPAQVIVGNYGVQYVSAAPSGTCSSSSPIQVLTSTGSVYSCQSGTWGTVGGSGSFNALTGDATSTSTGGATEVIGILNKTLPALTTGNLNYNGTVWNFSSAGSGTVSTVSVTTANGVSGTVATATTTPAITLTLGAITPTSIGSATTATTQSAKDNSTKIATTAYVDRPTGLTSGTSVTLAAPRQYFICTGACTITMPVPAAGYEFCVQNNVTVTSVITFAAIGSSAQYGNTAQTAYGTAGTGTLVSGGAAGDKMCLLGLDATHYNVASSVGTWVTN